MLEDTVVLVKPDAVKRGLIGRIINRFENAGLKIKAMKMIWVEQDIVAKHYADRDDFLESMGNKTLDTYRKYGKDPDEELGTRDPLEIGKLVRHWSIEFLTSGPLVAILLEGIHAVESVRKIIGNTMPLFAEPGTIRGEYSVDSPALANEKKRAVRNLVHASGNLEEANFERKLWFREEEIYQYQRADQQVMFE